MFIEELPPKPLPLGEESDQRMMQTQNHSNRFQQNLLLSHALCGATGKTQSYSGCHACCSHPKGFTEDAVSSPVSMKRAKTDRLTNLRVVKMCSTGFEHSNGCVSILAETVG